MKVSLNWLKDYISLGISAEKLAHRLTMAGLEVQKIHKVDGDTVFELEITPNRPDCLNMLGIARELGAVLNRGYIPFKVRQLHFPKKKCNITILDKKGCPRYIATLIEDAEIKETPLWIKKRISSLGLRLINNVVDITNFCLMETGQPLHAFDYDRLEGGKIIVRRAERGEKIVTLDGQARILEESILVIADAKKPIAIAGIMGGKEAEVTEQTKNILLESAYFDPLLIRRASRRLGLSSDSSYRFERGVDYNTVETGANRAIVLMLHNTRGIMTRRNDVVAIKKRTLKKQIILSVPKINSYLGVTMSTARCIDILRRLDFEVQQTKGDTLKIRPPAFRDDVTSTVDIKEEVARIFGYEKIPVSLPQIKATSIPESPRQKTRRVIREVLLGQGFDEAVCYSMVNHEALGKSNQGALIELPSSTPTNSFLYVDSSKFKEINIQKQNCRGTSHQNSLTAVEREKLNKGIRVKNPLTQDQEMMRPSALSGLLSVALKNVNCGNKDLRIFELGKAYLSGQEKEILGILACGRHLSDWRNPIRRQVDFYDIKGTLEALFERLGIEKLRFEAVTQSYLEVAQSARAILGDKETAVLGKVSQEVLEKWDIKEEGVYFGQVDLEEIYPRLQGPERFVPIPEHPCIVHDVSLTVKEGISFEQIREAAFSLGAGILTKVDFTEEYLGGHITAGHRGLVFSLTYQSPERTLTEEEVKAVHQPIVQAFKDKLGAVQR